MFVEVVVTDDGGRADALSDAFVEAGALSAAIEDADADTEAEDALYGEPGEAPRAWRRNRVVALFAQDADVDAALATAFAQAGVGERPHVERREVADADWVRATQAQFAPIAIGTRLWIVPSWHDDPEAAAGAIVLRLDPGVAFGTGDHPTTRLVLAWLATHLVPGQTVIDYGAGSGILAIAAKKLGASRVAGVDIDERAIAAARANAAANDVDVAFDASRAFASSPSLGVADVVVANILSNPLKVLAPLLTSLVAPGGTLVLSGVLERQWRDVASAYAPDIALDVAAVDGGWVCLAGSRA